MTNMNKLHMMLKFNLILKLNPYLIQKIATNQNKRVDLQKKEADLYVCPKKAFFELFFFAYSAQWFIYLIKTR